VEGTEHDKHVKSHKLSLHSLFECKVEKKENILHDAIVYSAIMLRCLSSQRSSSPHFDTQSNSNCRGHQKQDQVQRARKLKNLFCGKTKAINGAEMVVGDNSGDVASPSSKGQQLTWEKLSPEEFLQLQDFAECKSIFFQWLFWFKWSEFFGGMEFGKMLVENCNS